MKIQVATVLLFALPLVAQDDKPKEFEITAPVQAQIDAWKKTIAVWTADKVLVAAVLEQNEKGPIPDLDNKKWKALRRRSPEVEAFTKNDTAKQLADLAKASDGVVSEAFLSAAKGEKVAFLEKTTSYLHAGSAKFDTPMQKLTTWQGKPEFDESSQSYAIQIAVPVIDPKDPKHAIGVLVVGLNLTAIVAPKPPAPTK